MYGRYAPSSPMAKAWEGMKDPKTGKKAIMGSIVLLR
jgi:hypothetical protein